MDVLSGFTGGTLSQLRDQTGDTISGGGGHDTIVAGIGNDLIAGGAGDDLLNGGFDGDDTIDGGNGNDAIFAGDGNDWLTGGDGNDLMDGGDDRDTIFAGIGNDSIAGGAGADNLDGGAGDDIFDLANGDFDAGESIQGAEDSGSGTRDEIVLTIPTTVDFSLGTVSGVETLSGSSGNDTVTMSAKQWAGFSYWIDLDDGTDVLNIVASGDISTLAGPSIGQIETGNLTGTTGDDTVTLRGDQLDAIIIGAGTINLGDGYDTINLTSTSDDLNALGAQGFLGPNSIAYERVQGVEEISAAGATAGVKIILSGQHAAFKLTGGA